MLMTDPLARRDLKIAVVRGCTTDRRSVFVRWLNLPKGTNVNNISIADLSAG